MKNEKYFTCLNNNNLDQNILNNFVAQTIYHNNQII